MSKVKIVGNACVIESAAQLADLAMLQKYRPKALKLYENNDGKREEVFAIGVTKSGNGSISQYGASFAPQPTAGGKAAITMLIPEDVKNPVDWVQDTIGVTILYLNKIEEQLAGALDEVEAELAAVASSIELA